MNTKHCNSCGNTKPTSDFGLRAASSDGLSAKCKSCQSKYDQLRSNLPHRVEARKKYLQTERGRITSNNAKKAYIKRNPLKRAAHIVVGNALRDGLIEKSPCVVCGNSKAEAHHDDYNKPMEIIWLCDTHHKKRHSEMKHLGINP